MRSLSTEVGGSLKEYVDGISYQGLADSINITFYYLKIIASEMCSIIPNTDEGYTSTCVIVMKADIFQPFL